MSLWETIQREARALEGFSVTNPVNVETSSEGRELLDSGETATIEYRVLVVAPESEERKHYSTAVEDVNRAINSLLDAVNSPEQVSGGTRVFPINESNCDAEEDEPCYDSSHILRTGYQTGYVLYKEDIGTLNVPLNMTIDASDTLLSQGNTVLWNSSRRVTLQREIKIIFLAQYKDRASVEAALGRDKDRKYIRFEKTEKLCGSPVAF